MEQLLFEDTKYRHNKNHDTLPTECLVATTKARDVLENNPEALTVRERQFLHLLSNKHNPTNPLLIKLYDKVSIRDMMAFGLIEVDTLSIAYKKHVALMDKFSKKAKKTVDHNTDDSLLNLLHQDNDTK